VSPQSEPIPDDIVIIGDSAFAEIACEYFTHDSSHEVVAFAVESEFRESDRLLDRPVVDFETVEEQFPPDEFSAFVAVAYTDCNRLRERFCIEAKEKGYSLATYVSSHAFVWNESSLGENCFIFENNVVQPFTEIGNDVILWSGNHIGHHSNIDDHCFISSHVVISGFVSVGRNCFIGVNATVADNTDIGEYCLIGADTTILGDTADEEVYGSSQSELKPYSSTEYFSE